MSSVSLTPTRKMVTPTGSNYVILSPHHLSSGASALSNASTPSSTVVPTTPVSSSPLCTTENILLTSNKGKNGGKKPKRPGAYSTANMRPSSVARRNARERNRVRQVNNGFTALRDHLPPVPEDEVEVQQKNSKDKDKDKKISKVETLKRAVDYIKSLQRLLDQHDAMCSPGATSTSGSVPGGCLSPPGSFYSPAGSDSPSSTTPNTGWTSQQATIGGPQGHFQQHQLYAPQSMEHGQHLQSLIPDQQQYIYHQQSTAYGHQQPMSNHSSMSSLSPGAFSEAGSPTPSMSSEGSSPVRSTRVKVEHQLDSFQDLQQLNTSYARSYDELTPLSPDDEELLDAIAWWQQN